MAVTTNLARCTMARLRGAFVARMNASTVENGDSRLLCLSKGGLKHPPSLWGHCFPSVVALRAISKRDGVVNDVSEHILDARLRRSTRKKSRMS